MKKKYIITLALCVIAVLGYMFLPFIDVMGYEVTLAEFAEHIDFEAAGSDSEGMMIIIALLMTIVGGIVGIIGSFKSKKTMTMVSSIIAAVGIIAFLGGLEDAMGGLISIFDYLGSAPWIGILGFAGSAVVAGVMKDEA